MQHQICTIIIAILLCILAVILTGCANSEIGTASWFGPGVPCDLCGGHTRASMFNVRTCIQSGKVMYPKTVDNW